MSQTSYAELIQEAVLGVVRNDGFVVFIVAMNLIFAGYSATTPTYTQPLPMPPALAHLAVAVFLAESVSIQRYLSQGGDGDS